MALIEYIIGIFCSVLAGICFNLAPIIQKEALIQMEEVTFVKMGKSLKTMISSKKWIFGLFIALLGAIPYILAMSWVGISVVQPITNCGMIVLVIFSKKRLGERLNIIAKISIGFMIVMPLFIGLAGVSNVQRDLTDIPTRNNVFFFTGIMLIIILFCFVISKKYPIFLTIVVGTFFALGAYYMQAYTSMLAISGYIFPQDVGLIISQAFIDMNIVIANIFFIILLVFNGLAGFTLQIGLQKVPASKFNPIQQTINSAISVISGIIIFNQIITYWGFYIVGLIFAVLGTIILGKYQMD